MNGMVQKNIADFVIKPKQVKPEVKTFTVEEQKMLENTCLKHRLGVGIILALYTGVRLGELVGAKWGDIDFKAQILKIRRTLNRVSTPDDLDNKTQIIINKPKTATGCRDIPLQDFLIPLLLELQNKQHEERQLYGADYINEDYIICYEQGKFFEPRTFQDFFKKMLKLSGVPSTNFHVTRHTMATRALEQGFDIKVLSDILGHADASTTLNKYAHALPNHKRNSMNKLNKLWKQESNLEDDNGDY